MSFGFGVGDIMTVLDLANSLCQRFRDAPEQFRAISADSISKGQESIIVLHDIKFDLPQLDLTGNKAESLREIGAGCHEAHKTLNITLGNYQELGPNHKDSKPKDKVLRQLVQQKPFVPDSMKDLYQRHKDKRTRPSFDEISEVLHSVIASCSMVFILIDALHEYHFPHKDRRRVLSEIEDRRKVLSEVFKLPAKTGINLWVTSRFIPDIRDIMEESLLLYKDKQLTVARLRAMVLGLVAETERLLKTDLLFYEEAFHHHSSPYRMPTSSDLPVPSPSRSFTFRRKTDTSQRDKKSTASTSDGLLALPDALPRTDLDPSACNKPLPKPNEFQILQEELAADNNAPSPPSNIFAKIYRSNTDLLIKASDTYTADSGYLTSVQSFGQDIINSVSQVDGSLISSATNIIDNNSIIENAIHIAENLADLGKTMPFVAPAFVILKAIIDIEKKARDAESKCSDLLERINFMMGNLTVLENAAVIDAVKRVVARIEKTDKFTSCANKVKDITSDLLISLQIQQSGQLEILSRHVPVDAEDKLAQQFLNLHGEGAKNNPELVQEFAKQINRTVEPDTLQQLSMDMTEIIKNGQEDVKSLIEEHIADAIAKGFEDISARMAELDNEDKLLCVQCNQDYLDSLNGKTSCRFHKGSYDDWNKIWPCCGDANPCSRGPHAAKHHSDYPYDQFFHYAARINNYVDTVDAWASCLDTNLETSSEQTARVGKLLRWATRADRVDKNIILVHVGTVWYNTPYSFQTYTYEDLQKISMEPGSPAAKAVIFRTSADNDEFSMAEWTFGSDSTINGIKITAKAATSQIPTVKLVPISSLTADKTAEAQEITVGGFTIYKPKASYKLPDVHRIGPTLPSKATRPVRDDFVSTGSSSMTILLKSPLAANTKFSRTDADIFDGSISIFNKNKSEPIVLVAITAYYRMIGEQQYIKVETLDIDANRLPVKLDPLQPVHVDFKATILRKESDKKLGLRMWNRALVARDQPLRLKVVAQDIEGNRSSLVIDYVFNPMPADQANKDDIGFYFIDDPLRCARYSVRVKPGSGDSIVEIGSKSYSTQDLHRIVYGALKTNTSEVDQNINQDVDGLWQWNAWVLVDKSCRRVYAFKILVTNGSSVCVGYALCPDYGDTRDERDIRYATETAVLPDGKFEASPALPQTDDVDDIPTPAPMSKLNGQHTTNGIQIQKPFAGDAGSLEARLESIDRNLDRLATTMEALVSLLAQKS
ncbi:hypothetical protein BZG36_02559 [Bifiguratus adelaidae]|uniref:Fungal N-terminal domain-containing protein n=1 Tax=Bifiguratus adelaidae TaxID=1938954 RepID=A0A261Y245_9FUNG|nr:hypothetical protein BZG36_02559 [Bifiguratus adelaidae]